MALGAQVIDLVGLDVVQKVRELPGNGQIAVMKIDPRLGIMEVLVKMIDAVRIEGAGPTDQPVDLITLGEEEFGQIRSVLAGYAGDEGLFHKSKSSPCMLSGHLQAAGNGSPPWLPIRA